MAKFKIGKKFLKQILEVSIKHLADNGKEETLLKSLLIFN